jgi:signal transduction histidine kinase
MLKISDTGQGIEPQHLPHIFDPFFTTKQPPTEVAKKRDQPVGSGLGLSMVKMLLEPYGVRFDVQSKVGQGTTFSLLIPYKS